MSDHIHETIRTLEQEIEALDQRRGDLVRAIDALRPLAGETFKATPPASNNGNGNGASAPALDSLEARIVAMLRQRGAMKPGALTKALRMERTTLRLQLKNMAKAGLVEITGSTQNRQVSLPRKAAAKEAI